MSAEVETMAYNLETGVPWHGLGEPLNGLVDSEEMQTKAGLLWSVSKESMFLGDGSSVGGFYATVRSTDRRVLGIVGEKYHVFQPREMFSFADSLVAEVGEAQYESAGSLFNGKRIFILLKVPETVKVLGDDVEQYVVFSQGFDGSAAVDVCPTPVRVVCQNTLQMAISGAKRRWHVRHMGGSMSERIDEARQAIGLTKAYSEALRIQAEKLAEQKYDEKAAHFIERLFPLEENASERRRANVAENRSLLTQAFQSPTIGEFAGTKWGALMAVTDFVSHRTPQRDVQDKRKYAERRFANILSGDPILDQAVAMLTKAK